MKWISCKKRLPDDQEECLIAFHIIPGEPNCGFAFHLATFSQGSFSTWELNNQINCVTHWMPLPDNPE